MYESRFINTVYKVMDGRFTQFRILLLIGFTGQVVAEERPLSDSSIAALAVLFGFIVIVILLSLCCYCVRRQKQRSINRRKEKLNEIKKVFEEHYSEYSAPTLDDMVVLTSRDRPQTFAEWRSHQSSTSPAVLTTQPPSRESRYFVKSSRTARSISPTRTSPRAPIYERGRSKQKIVYQNRGENNTLVYQRSKSAPNLNRKEYVPSYPPSYPNRQLFYTKSHYLAIKQPFSKKYLLPPVRTFYAERPAAKRVVVPAPAPRQVVVPPPRQEVVKPNVYHVQYKASPNQIVHRTKLTENIDEDFRLQTTNTSQYQNTYQNYRSYEEPVHTTYRSYEEPVQTTYRTYEEPIQTTLTNYQPRVVRPQSSYVYRISNSDGGGLQAAEWSGETTGINTQLLTAPEGESAFQRTTTYTMNYTDEARVSNGTELNKTVADDFTIIDYVEEGQGQRSSNRVISGAGTSGTGVVTVISTTNAEEGQTHNSSALNALDNLLGDNASNKSSSSSSSSSRSSNSSKSSKKS